MRASRETADPRSAAHPLHTVALVCAIAAPLVLAGWLEAEPAPPTAPVRAMAAPRPAARAPLPPPAPPEPSPDVTPAPLELAARARADTARIRRSGGFTLQFAVMCREENVRQLLLGLGTDPRLFVLPASVEGRSCHRLCYGTYPGESQARDERAVPAALREITPSPRAVRVEQVAP